MAAYLNHDIYDSLINSGQINFLDYNMQQKIQNVFTKIKDHNTYLNKLITLEEEIEKNEFTYEEVPPIINKYCSFLIKFENDIKKTIPIITDELESKFNIL